MSSAGQYNREDIVRASAGTGKTYSLTQRLIQILAVGEKPERLLATTFTRKAAGEIKNRLFSRLAEDALDKKSHSSVPALKLLMRLTRSQHQLKISTMDSFFLAVVRAFAFELGLPPHWRLIESEEEEGVRQSSISAALAKSSSRELSALLQPLSGGSFVRGVYRRMQSHIADLHDIFRKSDLAAWFWFEAPPEIPQEALLSALAQAEQAALPRTKAGKPYASWQNAVREGLDAASAGRWEEFITKGIAKSMLGGSMLFGGKEIPAELAEAYRVMIEQAQAVILRKLEKRTRATAALLGYYSEDYDQRKLAYRVINFADLTYLLRHQIATSDQHEFYYRLDAELPHILFDEFQDTSAEQWRVLEPLAGEILAKSGAEYSFFCVGDVKQAIYGWRGGVSEIFDGLVARFPQLKSKIRSLDKSYRSSQTVIDFVNLVFNNLAANPALESGDAAYRDAALSWSKDFCKHETHKQDLAGYVALIEVDKTTEDDEDRSCIARRTAELVRDLVKCAPGADVGVLVRTNKTIPRVLLELRRPDIGIHASQEGGNPLTDSPAVVAVLALLRLADHPGDTAAQFLVDSSPLRGVLGAEPSRELRQRFANQGYGMTINEIASFAAPHASPADIFRLRHLVELAYLYEPQATGRVDDFVSFVERKKVEDAHPAQVRIMTIHKAKGLEFDIVVLPEIDNPLIRPGSDRLLVYSADPLAPPERIVCYPRSEVRQLSPALQEMHRTCRIEEIKEEFSVLYVALTRAKHAVYMLSADGQRNSVSFGSILRAAASKPQTAGGKGVLFEAGACCWYQQHPEKFTAAAKQPSRGIEETAGITLPDSTVRTRALIRQTPSALEGGSVIRLVDRLQLSSPSALIRGTVLHAFFEGILWLEDGVPDSSKLVQIASQHSSDQRSIAQLVQEFCELLKQPAAAELLSRTAPGRVGKDFEVFRELPFAVREGDSILTGTIDRFVIELKDGKPFAVEVVDYKSDRFNGPIEMLLKEKTNFYRPQIEAYKHIAARFAAVDLSRVSGKLFFLDIDQAIEI